MKRRAIFAANWKMHKTVSEMRSFFKEFLSSSIKDDRDIVIAPPFSLLYEASSLLSASEAKNVFVAAQNMFFEQKGAFTGEISPLMLKDAGVSHVILGHSERRHVFGESDALIAIKVKACIEAGLKPILCIGEKLEEREAARTFDVLSVQLSAGLCLVDAKDAANVIIAYEPVWAIGTGKTASPEQAQEVHNFIRIWLGKRFNSLAQNLPILYGGSVKPSNIAELMGKQDVDGVLVGGASLEAKAFAEISSITI